MKQAKTITIILLLFVGTLTAQDQLISNGNLQLHAGASIVFHSDFINNGNYDPTTSTVASYIDLSVSAGGYTDHAYIQFIDTAKFEFDIADATKLSNSIFNLATLSSDSVVLAINAISGNACEFDIPISLWNTWDDSYSFAWNITQDLLDDYSISLKDKYTNQTYNLNSITDGFDFYISKDAKTKETDRFMLHFTTANIDSNIFIETSQVCEAPGKVKINLIDNQYGVDYTLWQDDQVLATLTGTGAMLVFEIDSTLLTAGSNSFLIRATRSTCITQGVDFTVEFEYFEQPEINSVVDGLACDNSPITLLVSGAKNATSFRWYELEFDNVPIAETDSATFVIALLTASHIYYVSAINALGCESNRIPVEAKVILLQQPIITVDTIDYYNYELLSSYLKDNQWFFNNTLLSGETNQTLEASEPGFYAVHVTSAGCTVMSDSVEVNDLVLAIGDLSEQFKISMYPNPASDNVILEFPKFIKQDVQVMFISLDGRAQYQEEIAAQSNTTFDIDLKAYILGTYILKVIVDSHPYSYRLIIQ